MTSAPNWHHEEAARARGYAAIGGIDEAGRGPIAGPVVAACVVLPFGADMPDVQDSKKLSPSQREQAARRIRDCAQVVGVGTVPAKRIDEVNILRATQEAMREAALQCGDRLQFALVDGLPVPAFPVPHQAIVKGDSQSVSVAAASIIAKVSRDRMMLELDALYPGYGFAEHKGYPSPAHLRRLRELGPCPIHRVSFAPVREAVHRYRPHQRHLEEPAVDAGVAGEEVVRRYLEAHGMRILESRYRCLHGELDLVAEEGGEIVFVEVKTQMHTRRVGGREAVDRTKRNRLVLAAEAFLQERMIHDRNCRFDVAEVVLPPSGSPSVCLIRGAFIAGE